LRYRLVSLHLEGMRRHTVFTPYTHTTDSSMHTLYSRYLRLPQHPPRRKYNSTTNGSRAAPTPL
jgi:hypothetical protein